MNLSTLQYLLLFNACFLIFIIFFQNDNTKNAMNSKTTNSGVSPIELITWSSLSLQLVFLFLIARNTEL